MRIKEIQNYPTSNESRLFVPPLDIHQQITFLYASDLEATRQFYTRTLGLPLVRDQGTCLIFRTAKNAFLGFCEHLDPFPKSRQVILTFVSKDVDDWYQTLKSKGANIENAPKYNPKYEIYHFFLLDPDGYWIEIQQFDEPL